MRAVFVGENSLGYEHGKQYELNISIKDKIFIQKSCGQGLCVYDNIFLFLKNWRPIIKIGQPQAQIIIVDDLGNVTQLSDTERKNKLKKWYKDVILGK